MIKNLVQSLAYIDRNYEVRITNQELETKMK